MGGGGKIMFSIVYISLEDVPASFKKCSFDENDKNEKSFMQRYCDTFSYVLCANYGSVLFV